MLIRLILSLTDDALEKSLDEHISSSDVETERVGHTPNSWQRVVQSCADIIVISEDLIPPPVESGLGVLAALPEHPSTIVLHDKDSTDTQARFMSYGAHAALYSGIDRKNLLSALEATIEAKRQMLHMRFNERRKQPRPKMADFISANETMQLFMEDVKQVAASDSLLLITGETGVGKEHLAKMIHAESPRASGPFIAVNTAALPEQLLESELFGHKQGAFTGATRTRRGAFEQAHGGTIFLDEIGEMPLYLQAKLLRVLQDYEIRPIGADKASWIDVRVIAATNRDLQEAVADSLFRKDLFYRLSVVQLNIPPLRMRREDIPQLARRFLADFRVKICRDVHQISEEAMQAMEAYDWPGNVRELMNVIERSLLLCKTHQIDLCDLPDVFHSLLPAAQALLHSPSPACPPEWENMTLPQVMEQVRQHAEQTYLQMVLEKTGGRIAKSAKLAGITTRSIYTKMREYNIKKEEFKR